MARQVRKRGGLVGEIAIGALVVGAVIVIGGCDSGLGACDMAAATRVVYRGGVPHYEGQALVESRCAGGFCHSANAKGASRFGVPAEFNFDVTVVTPTQTALDVQHHREGLAAIADWAEDMSAAVADGEMPPGNAGKRDLGVWVRALADGSLPVGGINELFDIGSPQGHETLRNWLACGAPTVAGTDDLEPGLAAAVATLGGAVLPSKAGAACVPTAAGALAPVLDVGGCTSCHSVGPFLAQHMLDLSKDADGVGLSMAHAALFDQPARGNPCASSGTKLIVPGDCKNSLLYQKLAEVPSGVCSPLGPANCTSEPQKVCGDLMPSGRVGAFPQAALECLCSWIDAGAPL